MCKKEPMLRLRGAVLFLFVASILVPAASFSLPLPAVAQTPARGSISGTVVSDQGSLSAATVTIIGPATRTVQTAKDGRFTILDLPDGLYSVSIARAGYQAVRGTTVTIVSGLPQTIAVTLAADSLNSLRTIGSVTANGGRSSSALNTSASAEVTLTSQNYMDRGQTQVADLLEEQPGIEITRVDSGALGSNTDIAIRGANPYETQVLIDGHPVNGGRFGSYLIQFLNPLILSDIEVDKGPGAFGNTIENAIGGRVNFRTPTISANPTGSLLAGYDSFNGSMYGGRFSDTIGKFGFLVGYAQTGTPGYFANNTIFSVTDSSLTKAGQAPQPATINTAITSSQTYFNRSELLKGAFNFSPVTTLTLGYYGSQSLVDYTGTLTTAEPFRIVPCLPVATCNPATNTGTSFTNPNFLNLVGQSFLAAANGDDLFQGNNEADNEPIFTADFRTSFGPGTFLGRFYAGSITRLITDPAEPTQITGCPNAACNPATVDGEDFTQNETDQLHGYDFEYDVPVGVASLTASYDTHDDRTSFCATTSVANPALNCTINGLLKLSTTYTLRGYIPLSHKLTFGLANYFSDTTFVGSRYDPAASLVYRPSSKMSIRLAAGSSYVAPPADFITSVGGSTPVASGESVLNGKLEIENDLKPEFSSTFNAGADIATGKDSKFTIDLYNTILTNRFATDSITFSGGETATFNGTPITGISELFNRSKSHEQGIELGFIKAPKVGLGFVASLDLSRDYDFDTSTNQLLAGLPVTSTQTGAFNGLQNEIDGFQIPGYPYAHGRAEVNYQSPQGLTAAFGMTYYGDYNSFGQTAFELFDLRFALPLQQGFRLSASVINLFNHDDGRDLGEFENGAFIPPGETSPVTLFFAQPRQVTVQISHPL
jgi:hypothetical protein